MKQKGSSQISLYFWRIFTLALLGVFLFVSFEIWSFYGAKEKQALESGKRFIISIPTGKITIKEEKAEEAVTESIEPPIIPGPEVAHTPEAVPAPVPEGEKPPEAAPEAAIPEPVAAVPQQAVPVEGQPAGGQPASEQLPQEIAPGIAAPQPGTMPLPVKATDKSKPKIAIIISGLGLSKSSTAEAMELPKEITFSFSPYSNNLAEWMEKAKQAGHEVMIDLPLEPSDYPITDPGPYALLTSLSKEENMSRFKSLLNLSTGYIGLLTAKDEKFTASAISVAPMISEIRDRNLRLIFSEKNPNSPIFALAETINFKFWSSEMVVDEKISREEINKNLAEVEKVALKEGNVIAVARPYPITVKILQSWIEGLEGRGIELVPVSVLPDVAKRQ